MHRVALLLKNYRNDLIGPVQHEAEVKKYLDQEGLGWVVDPTKVPLVMDKVFASLGIAFLILISCDMVKRWVLLSIMGCLLGKSANMSLEFTRSKGNHAGRGNPMDS